MKKQMVYNFELGEVIEKMIGKENPFYMEPWEAHWSMNNKKIVITVEKLSN